MEIVYGSKDDIYETRVDPPGLSLPQKIASDESLGVTLRPAGKQAGSKFDHDWRKGELKVLVLAGRQRLYAPMPRAENIEFPPPKPSDAH